MTDSHTTKNLLAMFDEKAIPMAIATVRRHMQGQVTGQPLMPALDTLIKDGRVLRRRGDDWFEDPLTQNLRAYRSGPPYFMSAAAYEKLKNAKS